MKYDLMLDIEALGARPDTVILSIAAQQFDPLAHGWVTETQHDGVLGRDYQPSLDVRVDVDQQIQEYHRTQDADTMAWWGRQSTDAIEAAFGLADRVSLNSALEQLCTLASNSNRIWARGSTYDVPIIEHALSQVGRPKPWRFWAVHELRTVLLLCPDLAKIKINSHVALDDVHNQIMLLQEAFRQLAVKELP